MAEPVFVPYLHTLPPTGCGFVAFHVFREVGASSLIRGMALRRADGGMVRFEDQRRCTTCGRRVTWPVPLPAGRLEVEV